MQFINMEEKHITGVMALWNDEFGSIYPMRDRLFRQTVFNDPNWLAEGSFVAIEPDSERIVGFVTAKHPGDRLESFGIQKNHGWIQALLVATDSRRTGIGERLLRQAEAALRHAGASTISLGNDLHSRWFPGIPVESGDAKSWFVERGYNITEHVFDLIHSYEEGDITDPWPELNDASVRLATKADQEALTAFMARCFPGTWDYQQQEYWNRGGTGREFVLLERSGELIGYCRINDASSPLLAQNIYWAPLFTEPMGGIGPLGVDERFRGHKYGIKIVQAAIRYLRDRGNRVIVIDTTPFVEFYGKLGYMTWRTYAKCVKNVDEI